MDTELTLKLDKRIVEKAKEYASENNQSLSRIIESYLRLLLIKKDKNESDIQISPFIKSMSSGIHIPAELDYKEEYFNHLTEKYE
jgi:hypothetical protein